MASNVPPQLVSLEIQVRAIFKLLSTGFQRLDRIKNVDRQKVQLEELTAKMREAKRMIKEFEREMKAEEEERGPPTNKLLNERKQSLIKELNSYVSLRKTYTQSFVSNHELLDGGSFSLSVHEHGDYSVITPTSKREGKKPTDEADLTKETSEKVKEDTINPGAETPVPSTEEHHAEQPPPKTNKASKLVKKIGGQIAANRIILLFLALGVMVTVIVLGIQFVPSHVQAAPPT